MPLKDAGYMRVLKLIFSTLLLSGSALAADPKIASTSLCGDSYLLAFAPDQTSHLSWQSRDALSTATEPQNLPQAWDDPEVLLSLETDLILFGPGEGLKTKAFLDTVGIAHKSLMWGEDFETVKSNAELLTDQNIDLTGLEALKAQSKKRGKSYKVLYLSRSGGTAGPGTFVDAVIQAAGAENAVRTSGWFTPDPESLLSIETDVVMTSFFTKGYESINSNGLRHKAVSHYIEQFPRIDIPGELWPCAGPGLITAAQILADELDKLP